MSIVALFTKVIMVFCWIVLINSNSTISDVAPEVSNKPSVAETITAINSKQKTNIVLFYYKSIVGKL
jgi:hypothetical protein